MILGSFVLLTGQFRPIISISYHQFKYYLMATPILSPTPSPDTFVQLEPMIQTPTNPIVVVGSAEQLKLHPCSTEGCQYAATAKCSDCESMLCVEHAKVVTNGRSTATMCDRCRKNSRVRTEICIAICFIFVIVVIGIFALVRLY